MAKRRDTGLFAGPMMPESRGYGQQANVLGGTMGAVVYGQNPAAQNLAGNLNAVRQAEQMRLAQQQADAQQLAQSWRDNELEAAEGMLWADQLGAVEQQHIATGQELMQEGINPYESMNPRAVAYRRQRRDILNQRAYRKGIESQYMKTLEEIRKNPNKYRPDDIQRLNEWISGTNLTDAYSQNQQIPMLRQRFDPSEVLKGVRAVTTSTTDVKDGWKTERTQIDRPQTEGLILGQLINAPGGAEYLAELTGGLPVNEVLSVPDSRSDIVSALKEGYSGNPRIREQLAAQGIVGDKMVEEWANNEASRFLGAKKNLKSFLDRQVDAAASGVKLEESRTPDTTLADLAIKKRNSDISAGREARLLREAESGGSDVTYIGADSVPAGRASSGNSGIVPINNAINLYNATVSVTGGGAYNLDSRSKERDTPSIEGRIVNIGEYPFDSNGEVLDESQVSSPDSVEWRKMALIRQTQDGITKNLLVPASKIPSTLSGNKQKIVNEFLKNAEIEQETQTKDADPLGLGI